MFSIRKEHLLPSMYMALTQFTCICTGDRLKIILNFVVFIFEFGLSTHLKSRILFTLNFVHFIYFKLHSLNDVNVLKNFRLFVKCQKFSYLVSAFLAVMFLHTEKVLKKPCEMKQQQHLYFT